MSPRQPTSVDDGRTKPGTGRTAIITGMIAVGLVVIVIVVWQLISQRPDPRLSPSEDLPAARELALAGVSSNAEWTPTLVEINGVAMALVPAGCFLMGSNEENNEQPVHEVCFEQPYWIDLTEVTNRQFAAFNGQAGRRSTWTDSERPRESVTWTEAAAFCELRGARLPTEAEWEYASRGPDGLIYPWGDEFVSDNAVWNSSEAANVGSKPAGASWVGALDMTGNVWEWVHDWYHDDGYGSAVAEGAVNPQGLDDSTGFHVLRGGAWDVINTNGLRGANRYRALPSMEFNFIGFRCALSYSL